MEDIFKQASKLGVTFNFRGVIGLSDLWDLSQKDLDKIYRDLTAERRELQGDGLMEERKSNALLELKIEVVKAVFEQKKADIDERSLAVAKKERKQKLKELLAQKQDEQLSALSVEEIQRLIDEV